MNHAYHTNLLIGSKLALAMAMAIGSPVQAQFANPSERKRLMAAKMAKRCESIRKRSLKLLEEMKAQDIEIGADAAGMNRAPSRQKTELMAAVLGKMMEQNVALHSRVEDILGEMMQIIQGGK